jgi:hypothetical protein
VERPSIEGDVAFCVHAQFSSGPAEVQPEQIPQLGGSNAYPDQPFWLCRLENDMAGGGGLPEPELVTVNWTVALDDHPQLSDS